MLNADFKKRRKTSDVMRDDCKDIKKLLNEIKENEEELLKELTYACNCTDYRETMQECALYINHLTEEIDILRILVKKMADLYYDNI